MVRISCDDDVRYRLRSIADFYKIDVNTLLDALTIGPFCDIQDRNMDDTACKSRRESFLHLISDAIQHRENEASSVPEA